MGMKIAVACDSFKGSLTSLEAGDAIRRGILQALPDARVRVRPLADGGEGTVAALTRGMGGRLERVAVTGPLGSPVECEYGVLKGGTAVIEMAGAAGLTLVPEGARNPMNTTTYGVGEVILDAIAKGCRRFIVGIGGSATNDGGVGMLQALGFGMRDGRGESVPFGARGLGALKRISREGVPPELGDCRFRVACDVTNPLCGDRGASAVFGPQKGATPEMVERMDAWLRAYAELAAKLNPRADPERPGAGAAGGLGFALLSFTNATLESGARIVLEETRLEDYVRDADVVVTGEGCLDGQTVLGKAPIGVAALAKRHGKPVLAFAGRVAEGARACNSAGIDAYFPIPRGPIDPRDAMDRDVAGRNLSAAAEQAFRLIRRLRER